jgi:dephospho-CoA kinase
MSPGRKAWRQVAGHFGPAILNPDRTIDRAKLAAIIFSNERERRFLDSVVHPLVMAEKRKTVLELGKSGRHKIYVSEAALTLEAGLSGFFDRIIVTDCPLRLQVSRLMERNGLSRSDAYKRIRVQLTRSARLRQADYVIDTSGSLERTVEQAEAVAAELKRDYKRRLSGMTLHDDGGRRLRTGARRQKAAP